MCVCLCHNSKNSDSSILTYTHHRIKRAPGNESCIRELRHYKYNFPSPLSRQPVPTQRACITSCLRVPDQCKAVIFFKKADVSKQTCEIYGDSSETTKNVELVEVDDTDGDVTSIFEVLSVCPGTSTQPVIEKIAKTSKQSKTRDAVENTTVLGKHNAQQTINSQILNHSMEQTR